MVMNGVPNAGHSTTMITSELGSGVDSTLVNLALEINPLDRPEMDAIDDKITQTLGGAVVRAMGWVPGQSLFYLRSYYEQGLIRLAAETMSDKELARMDARAARIFRESGQETQFAHESLIDLMVR